MHWVFGRFGRAWQAAVGIVDRGMFMEQSYHDETTPLGTRYKLDVGQRHAWLFQGAPATEAKHHNNNIGTEYHYGPTLVC